MTDDEKLKKFNDYLDAGRRLHSLYEQEAELEDELSETWAELAGGDGIMFSMHAGELEEVANKLGLEWSGGLWAQAKLPSK